MKIECLFIGLVLGFSLNLLASEKVLKFDTFSLEEGLSQTTVPSKIQDREEEINQIADYFSKSDWEFKL